MGPAEDEPISRDDRLDTYLAIIAAEFASAPEDAEALARWLKLDSAQIRLMRDSARLAALWSRLGEEEQRPSETYHLLHGLDIAALHAYTRIKALSKDGVAWSRLHDYLDRLRYIKPLLGGDYLRKQGIPPGPIYRQILDDLLNAKLNSELSTREDEEKFIQNRLSSH
jgi:tRNA nucleotidyltransferase (CCA-adding enzyme)